MKYLIYLVLSIIALYFLGEWIKYDNKQLVDNAAFSVGKLTLYQGEGVNIVVPGRFSSVGHDAYIIFSYTNDAGDILSTSYSNGPGIQKLPDSGLDHLEGNHFLVVFNQNELKDARMIFDYPIKDSAEAMSKIDSIGQHFLEHYKNKTE